MPMSGGGLVKLLEELNELGVEAAKKLAYYHTDDHPDGKGSLRTRLENESGDVLAAIKFVCDKHGLNIEAIHARAQRKIALFEQWDREESNAGEAFDAKTNEGKQC